MVMTGGHQREEDTVPYQREHEALISKALETSGGGIPDFVAFIAATEEDPIDRMNFSGDGTVQDYPTITLDRPVAGTYAQVAVGLSDGYATLHAHDEWIQIQAGAQPGQTEPIMDLKDDLGVSAIQMFSDDSNGSEIYILGTAGGGHYAELLVSDGQNKGFIDLIASEAQGGKLIVGNNSTTYALVAQAANSGGPKLAFFGAALTTKPTGVAVTAAGVHAALVTLGLIAA